MGITVEAVYENGTLKAERPLPLQEHEKVRVTVDRHPSLAEQCYGMLPSRLAKQQGKDPGFAVSPCSALYAGDRT